MEEFLELVLFPSKKSRRHSFELREINADRSILYAEKELTVRARAAARWLQRVTKPGARIALSVDNGALYFSLYWAILMSGRTTVELSSELAEPELEARLSKVRPELLIRQKVDSSATEGLQITDGWGAELPSDGLLQALSPESEETEPWLESQPVNQLASIVFTSGTTGGLKAVCLSRSNLYWVTDAIAESFAPLGEPSAEVYSAFLPFCHSYGKSVLLLAVREGGSLVTTDRALTAPTMLALIKEQKITHLSLVPMQAKMLLKSPRFEQASLPSIRRITVAGGPLDRGSVTSLLERFPNKVLTMYGLTEASTRVSCMPSADLARRPESSGLPLLGVEIRIGEEKEVLLRGPNIMEGYFDDAEATALALRDGWLHTGDLGRLDKEGYLYVEGRIKDTVKTAGVSISTSQVEDCLSRLPGIEAVAVVGVPDELLGEKIKAIMVGAPCPPEEIRRYCRSHLGPQFVPHEIEFRASLPYTFSGKINKQALQSESS